jgi:hypothetical protein
MVLHHLMAELRDIRHEHFVRELVRTGGNGAEAYRRVSHRFPNKPLRNPNSARVIAHHIRKRPEVRRREQELKEIMSKKSDITIEKVLTDYQYALDMAKEMAKPADVISAASAQAKLVGLLRERVENGNVGDFDGMENVSDIIQKVADDVGPEAASALLTAFGLNNAETAKEEAPSLIDQTPPSGSVN